MVRGRSMGFVASGASKRTYAHELGHGAFGLEHTFPEIGQSLSNNLMDYGDSTHLTHKQCKDIAKRKFVFSWLDSEEDGSEQAGKKYKITSLIFTSNNWKVKKDNGVSSVYHWNERKNLCSPAVFVKKTKPKLRAIFDYPKKDVLTKIWVKATNTDGYNIAQKEAVINTVVAAGKNFTVSDAEFTKELPDSVGLIEKLELNWFFSTDSTSWLPCGKSENKIYFTLNTPARLDSLFETVLHIGCTNAKNKTNEIDVFNGIWTYFTTKNIKNVAGEALSYYGDPFTNLLTTKQLLTNKVGQCGSFTRLFLDILYAQGIDTGTGNYATFSTLGHVGDKDYGFFVKNWAFNGNGTSGDVQYPYINIPYAQKDTEGNISPFIRKADKTYYWVGSPEVTDNQGVTGQNNANPSSNFDNHQLVFYNNKFYDPSYGVSYNTETELSTGAIQGFYKTVYRVKNESEVGFDVDGNGTATDDIPTYPIYLIKKNLSGLQIKVNYSNY